MRDEEALATALIVATRSRFISKRRAAVCRITRKMCHSISYRAQENKGRKRERGRKISTTARRECCKKVIGKIKAIKSDNRKSWHRSRIFRRKTLPLLRDALQKVPTCIRNDIANGKCAAAFSLLLYFLLQRQIHFSVRRTVERLNGARPITVINCYCDIYTAVHTADVILTSDCLQCKVLLRSIYGIWYAY